MSIQTNIFENGRWVTRDLDPYQVRSQNTPRKEDKTKASAVKATPAPFFGLLTRTLTRSSVIKQIIPARIRKKFKNDVLFISTDSVTIKEASGNYTLEDVISFDLFDSAVRIGRIMGDRRDLDRGDKYATARKYTHWNDALYDIPPTGNHHEKQVETNERVLPPHILVLVLASNKLVFMCASDKEDDFIYGFHELRHATSPNEKLGAYLAVDPR